MKKLFSNPFFYASFGLVVFVIASRWYFIGSSLWHDDAFNFVYKALSLAIDHAYSNAHSTGYPFWIAVLAGGLSLWHAATGAWNIVVAPNVITVLFSIMLIVPVFVMAVRLFANRYYALVGTFLVCINPIIWRWGAIAMSDIFALTFFVAAAALALLFIQTHKFWMLYVSAGMLYIAMMTRVVYVLLVPIVFITVVYARKQFSKKEWLHGATAYVMAIILTLVSYAAFNGGSLHILLSDFGYVVPSFSDVLNTVGIIFSGIGPLFIPFVIFGGWYLIKRDKMSAIFLLTSIGLFTLYYAGWYTNGLFDIERYGMVVIVLATLVAAYSLLGPPWLRLSFLVVVFLMLFFAHGLVRPVMFYKTYATGETIFESYYLKYQQIAQQKLIDGDLQTYQDVLTIAEPNDTVLRWSNDWSIPQLVFAGAHRDVTPQLIGVDTVDDVVEAVRSANGRVYLLRGAFKQAQDAISTGVLEENIESVVVNGRSLIYFIE